MAIDPSASGVATSALQAIPFESLIGGPLDAGVKAQVMAAKATTDFIQAVGFNTDSAGNKSAVNVVFQYERDGKTVNLTVPMLVIVQVPFIGVDLITIDFKANISASASSVQSEETTVEKGASGTVSGHVGGRRWGVSATFNANYSSKKDSKSTQESKYSVEYTMDVHVEAKQDSMPAGLAAVLNILTSAITEQPAPTAGITVDVSASDKAKKSRTVTVTVPANAVTANTKVTLTLTGTEATTYSLAPASPVPVGTDGTAVTEVKWTGSVDPTDITKLDLQVTSGSTNVGTKQTVDVTYKP
jgi:hypothetical protein